MPQNWLMARQILLQKDISLLESIRVSTAH